MKILKFATISLTSLLMVTSFTGCGESQNSTASNSTASDSTVSTQTSNNSTSNNFASSSSTPSTSSSSTPTSSSTSGSSSISFENVKNGDMFYFLGKSTNTVSKYPAVGFNYSLVTIDMEDSTEAEIAELQNNGTFVICYISAGTSENGRSDEASFAAYTGNGVSGWPDEKWLDISNPAVLSLMQKRIDKAAAKGCNGIEFDNVDGYSNNTGFALSYQNQIDYNKGLAQYAKSKNLKTALKNDVDQVADLEPYFDMAINEECNSYNECAPYDKFLSDNKPVFNIEYSEPKNLYAQTSLFKSYLADLDLTGKKYLKLPLQ